MKVLIARFGSFHYSLLVGGGSVSAAEGDYDGWIHIFQRALTTPRWPSDLPNASADDVIVVNDPQEASRLIEEGGVTGILFITSGEEATADRFYREFPTVNVALATGLSPSMMDSVEGVLIIDKLRWNDEAGELMRRHLLLGRQPLET
jgi:hypothetical protein